MDRDDLAGSLAAGGGEGTKKPKHIQLRGRRTVEIPHLGVKVTAQPKDGHPGVLIELLTLPDDSVQIEP
jgi:hypothetical protein